MLLNRKDSVLQIDADLSALAQVSEAVGDLLEQVPDLPEPTKTAYNIQLAVHELCANIVQHARVDTGQIVLVLQLRTDPLRLEVHSLDRGAVHFVENEWRAPDFAEPPEGGLGIWLIKQLMDQALYTPLANGNRWRLVKFLSPADADAPPAPARAEEPQMTTKTIAIREQVQRTVVVSLLDRLDVASVPAFRAQIAPYLEQGDRDFIIDLSPTPFLDSAGMAALVSLLKHCRRRGGDVRLVWPRQQAVRRVLELTRFDQVFVMLESASA